jgi:hypothetical protein
MNPLPDILTVVFALAAAGAGCLMLHLLIEWYDQDRSRPADRR